MDIETRVARLEDVVKLHMGRSAVLERATFALIYELKKISPDAVEVVLQDALAADFWAGIGSPEDTEAFTKGVNGALQRLEGILKDK